MVGAAMLGVAPFIVSLVVQGTPANADVMCADVWLVHRDGTREYKAGPSNCLETGMSHWFTFGTEPTSTRIPGPYIGAGVEFKVTSP
jgi:hypothetical protein